MRSRIRGAGYWKLNTSILERQPFSDVTQKFWHDWQDQKLYYNSIINWWGIGKLYFKMLATHYCVQMQKNINHKQTELMEFIKAKKSKPNPYQNKINNAYQHVQDIDN